MKKDNQNLKFKHSPIGPIPKDWEVRRLGDIVEVKGGYAFDSRKFKDQGTYQVVKMSNLYDSALDLNRSKSFLDELNNAEKESLLKVGNIVITLTGTTGKRDYGYSYLIQEEKNLVVNQRVAKISVIEGDPKYLFYEFKTNRFLDQFFYSARGGTGNQANIGTADLLSIKIPLPCASEQREIGLALSTWDKAIAKTTQLITAKEQRKKWLMQQLLTGKKRLKGFKDAWRISNFDDCFEIIKSYSISRDGLSRDLNDSSTYCIHYGDIHALYETNFLDFSKQIGIPQITGIEQSISERDYLFDGDLVLADASEDYEGVGETIEVTNLGKKAAVGGLHTIVMRAKQNKVSVGYRAYLFASEPLRNELRRKATGTSVYSVTKSTLQTLSFKLPSMEEQKAISNILQTADKEINLLKQKLQAYKEQKKGLMQVLLTGKVRLKVKETA
ncbi:MAG: restriction endonuclease subunit S [Chitinophagales bacterium]